jgi:hypothetical protein
MGNGLYALKADAATPHYSRVSRRAFVALRPDVSNP